MITLAKYKKGRTTMGVVVVVVERGQEEGERKKRRRRRGINLKSELLLSNCVQYANDNGVCKKKKIQTRESRFRVLFPFLRTEDAHLRHFSSISDSFFLRVIRSVVFSI